MTISRRDSVKSALALAAGALATSHGDGVQETTLAAGTPDVDGDYELTIFLTYDLQDGSARRTGGTTQITYGQFEVAAGRENGAWRMRVQQVLVDDDEPVYGPDVLDVRDQTDGPDPLALLQGLLAGHVALDGSRVVSGLSARQVHALHALPADLRGALLGLMRRDDDDDDDDTFGRWFGRWALTASATELDGFSTTNAAYMTLAARVRAENLPARWAAHERDELLARAAAWDRIAAR